VAPDQRLVDDHQVELARQLCRDSIDYLERQLGASTLRPPGGKALIRRLASLKDRLEQLERVLEAIAQPTHSEDRPEAR
jgi:hypothetical protein